MCWSGWGNDSDTFEQCANGRTDLISNNRVVSLNKIFSMFRRTVYRSIEEAGAHPANVRRLQLFEAGLTVEAFAELIPRLAHVRDIEVGWQSWTELPHELSKLEKLCSLRVFNTPIQIFPGFIASCPRLVELVLRGTDIAGIPKSVNTLQHLQRLDFSNNPVREISPELGQLSNLRELQLSDNGLTTLPQSVAGLRRLRSLGLAGNCFSTVEAARIRGWYPHGVVTV